MVKTTTATELPLENLEQGHRYGLIITGAASNVSLKFRHATDENWYDLPGFTGTMATVISADFFCISSEMKLVLAAPQATPYHVSLVCAAAATF